MSGLGLLIGEETKNLQWLILTRVKCTDEEDLVQLVECCKNVKTMNHLMLLGCGTNADGRLSRHITGLHNPKKSLGVIALHDDGQLLVEKCQLSTEMTEKLWSCLRSFTSLNHPTISDSSLSFPPSPPKLLSVTKLSAERVTSQSYEGLLSSLSGLRDIDITIDDAEKDIPQITACLRRTVGQQLTRIDLTAPSSLPSEKNRVSRETMRGLSLLIREQTKNLYWLILTRVKCTDEEDLVELVECCRNVKTMNHLMLLGCGTNADGRLSRHITGLHNPKKSLGVIALHDDGQLRVEKYQLSTEMTKKLWSCLRSFTSLNRLTISDSSLSFPPSPPELPSVTKLLAESMTSQSYGGLLSSLPGLRDIDITIDDAERDIPQITACLRRAGGQKLTQINLVAPPSLPSEKKSVSRETMRGLGLLIREQTKNLQWLCLSRVKGTDEEDFVELVECCKHVKTINHLMLLGCGTNADGRLSRHITGLHNPKKSLRVITLHDDGQLLVEKCQLSTEMTEKLCDIDITIDDAERDIPQITAGLRRIRGQQLTRIRLRAPYTLPSEKNRVSRETMRGLGLLIREQTKKLEQLELYWVKCTDEEDLVYLIECCRPCVNMMSHVW
ncbi:uncharacterized protein LOC105441905 [Strongylocentrotus purpuratus]|uniref:RNI-like protein n=1 Tax=Strongylocentrotus purpuratus TaxID=7668 RepID=A0A7M7PE77_STRPU|nr:uncharacterized protein LOC105441905 [Strongylocentrotus purpuratus]